MENLMKYLPKNVQDVVTTKEHPDKLHIPRVEEDVLRWEEGLGVGRTHFENRLSELILEGMHEAGVLHKES